MSGALQISDEPGTPAPGGVTITSQPYSASGDVTASGGSNTNAGDWQAGFMQTVVSSNKNLDYRDASDTHVAYMKLALPGPHRDGIAGIEPWYDDNTVRDFATTNSTVTPEMSDAPGVAGVPWSLSLGATTASLRASSGKDEYCSWLMVRHKSTGDITYLNWDTWEIDWTATYDPVAKTGSGSGTGCRVTGKGAGQGSVTPLTKDPVANGADVQSLVP